MRSTLWQVVVKFVAGTNFPNAGGRMLVDRTDFGRCPQHWRPPGASGRRAQQRAETALGLRTLRTYALTKGLRPLLPKRGLRHKPTHIRRMTTGFFGPLLHKSMLVDIYRRTIIVHSTGVEPCLVTPVRAVRRCSFCSSYCVSGAVRLQWSHPTERRTVRNSADRRSTRPDRARPRLPGRG